MEKKFQITDDIACAETLPAEVYVDPAWYERAKEKIFARSWQFIGEAAQVKRPVMSGRSRCSKVVSIYLAVLVARLVGLHIVHGNDPRS